MNTETNKLIETLAAKLGTTTEYLWGVLLRQAPIDATICLLANVVIIIMGVVLYKVHQHFKDKETSDAFEFLFPIVCLVFASCAIVLPIVTISNIINGYFNPEFWALDYIINHIK